MLYREREGRIARAVTVGAVAALFAVGSVASAQQRWGDWRAELDRKARQGTLRVGDFYARPVTTWKQRNDLKAETESVHNALRKLALKNTKVEGDAIVGETKVRNTDLFVILYCSRPRVVTEIPKKLWMAVKPKKPLKLREIIPGLPRIPILDDLFKDELLLFTPREKLTVSSKELPPSVLKHFQHASGQKEFSFALGETKAGEGKAGLTVISHVDLRKLDLLHRALQMLGARGSIVTLVGTFSSPALAFLEEKPDAAAEPRLHLLGLLPSFKPKIGPLQFPKIQLRADGTFTKGRSVLALRAETELTAWRQKLGVILTPSLTFEAGAKPKVAVSVKVTPSLKNPGIPWNQPFGLPLKWLTVKDVDFRMDVSSPDVPLGLSGQVEIGPGKWLDLAGSVSLSTLVPTALTFRALPPNPNVVGSLELKDLAGFLDRVLGSYGLNTQFAAVAAKLPRVLLKGVAPGEGPVIDVNLDKTDPKAGVSDLRGVLEVNGKVLGRVTRGQANQRGIDVSAEVDLPVAGVGLRGTLGVSQIGPTRAVATFRAELGLGASTIYVEGTSDSGYSRMNLKGQGALQVLGKELAGFAFEGSTSDPQVSVSFEIPGLAKATLRASLSDLWNAIQQKVKTLLFESIRNLAVTAFTTLKSGIEKAMKMAQQGAKKAVDLGKQAWDDLKKGVDATLNAARTAAAAVRDTAKKAWEAASRALGWWNNTLNDAWNALRNLGCGICDAFARSVCPPCCKSCDDRKRDRENAKRDAENARNRQAAEERSQAQHKAAKEAELAALDAAQKTKGEALALVEKLRGRGELQASLEGCGAFYQQGASRHHNCQLLDSIFREVNWRRLLAYELADKLSQKVWEECTPWWSYGAGGPGKTPPPGAKRAECDLLGEIPSTDRLRLAGAKAEEYRQDLVAAEAEHRAKMAAIAKAEAMGVRGLRMCAENELARTGAPTDRPCYLAWAALPPAIRNADDPAAAATFRTNHFLRVGEFLQSPNREHYAVQLPDGRLAIFRGRGPTMDLRLPLDGYQTLYLGNKIFYQRRFETALRVMEPMLMWASGPRPKGGSLGDHFAIAQEDGNFAVYRGRGPSDRQKAFVWDAGAKGSDPTVALHDDGRMSLSVWRSGRQQEVWSSARTFLLIERFLGAGRYLVSPGGQRFAIMQDDGNLVVYRGRPWDLKGFVWNTGAAKGGGSAFAVLHRSGELTVHRGNPPENIDEVTSREMLWRSGTRDLTCNVPPTQAGPRCVFSLVVRDDGGLAVIRGTPRFPTGTLWEGPR